MSSLSLSQIQVQILRIGVPICMIIGNICSLIGLFVFIQKSMRKSSCIILLIGYLLTNLIYINFTILSALLSGYNLDFSTKSLTLCRFRMYFSFIFSAIPSYLLVSASLDRMFISSSNIHIRQRSNRRFALLMIIGISSFWILFHLHALFYSEIQLIYGIKLSCTTQSCIPSSFISYYGLINAIIPIILMGIFGIRTLININQAQRNNIHSKERRLIVLLIIQLSIYIFFRLPTSIYLVYGEITKYYVKNSNQILIEQFIYFIAIFCQFIQVSISPLMNLITKTFRIEFIRAIYKLFRIRSRRDQLDTVFSQTKNNNTLKLMQITTYFNNANTIKPVHQLPEIKSN